MAIKNFDKIAQEQLKFLELEYGFKPKKCKKENWGYDLMYLNNTTGVKITYEFREAYIFIMLFRLVEGQFQENPKNIDDDSVLYGYALDDIINLRNSNALIKPAYEYGADSQYYDKDKGLELYTSAFADNLKTYAKDVLGGVFTVFHEVDKIVKERAKKFR